ncbi:MAG: DNA repair protein RecO [Alphaproteobacteria bacterium]|nr:DNA repair protein RecO [Alphaproteobacteria bacterium]
MDWTDDGIVLGLRKHGENDTIVTLFTHEHGRHLGIVHGGNGRRVRGIYQPGNLVRARWRARLSEHLGSFTCELVRSFAGTALDDALRLAALTSACAVANASLPEREPHAAAYRGFLGFLAVLDASNWPSAYVRWELLLLAELGYGLDLAACAATGSETDLLYVSPRTGRAVSAGAGAPYADRLLPLPAFLIRDAAWDTAAIRDGLRLTGHFLDRHIFASRKEGEPPARTRFMGCMLEKTT